ncbi:uncharacterized protein LOC131249574 [Magnolia sinica]|uniref:uncharacterized protein LOC131249574 n=1 Tax=Magnolia sinica TaxID=86752 RepID=UPI0026590EB5|nr:uncharacterized protein LOC131249574 [Magnolia sinica]
MITPNSIIDLATLTFLLILIFISIFSISFIFHFRLKTLNSSQHLRDFNSLWPTRILLVSFVLLWSLSELLRLSLPSKVLTLPQQQSLCKAYIVASQGIFQPAFFLTLLFLVSVSLHCSNYHNTLPKALSTILLTCLPVLFLQVFFVFFSSRVSIFRNLPEIFRRDSVVLRRAGHTDRIFCAYPLFSTVVLSGFGGGFLTWFLVVCWRAVSLVINKTLRVRIFGLAFSVAFFVPAQAVCLALSVWWKPGDAVFEVLSFVGFLSVLVCAVVGEGILVIRPMADALVVEGTLLGATSSGKFRAVC